MLLSVPEVINRAAHRTFGRPLLAWDHLDIVVDGMIEWALAPDWELRGSAKDTGRFVHRDGTSLDVKTFAALDQRGVARPAPARWAQHFYPEPESGPAFLNADLLILAHHPETDPMRADHRDARQWQFYVVESARLPRQAKISETNLVQIATACGLGEVIAAVSWASRMHKTSDDNRNALGQDIG